MATISRTWRARRTDTTADDDATTPPDDDAARRDRRTDTTAAADAARRTGTKRAREWEALKRSLPDSYHEGDTIPHPPAQVVELVNALANDTAQTQSENPPATLLSPFSGQHAHATRGGTPGPSRLDAPSLPARAMDQARKMDR